MFGRLSLLSEEGAVLFERLDGRFLDIVLGADLFVDLSEVLDALVVLDKL